MGYIHTYIYTYIPTVLLLQVCKFNRIESEMYERMNVRTFPDVIVGVALLAVLHKMQFYLYLYKLEAS